MPDPRQLYAPMLERDLERTRSLSLEFASAHGPEALFHAVSRFAALAFNPSQHGRHAFLAALSASDVREEAGDEWPRVLAECAVYAAEGRLPWSEAPPLEPPAARDGDRLDLDGIRSAIAGHDRAGAERWLGARAARPDLIDDYFMAAVEDLGDAGHPLIVSTAAWKLSLLQDAHPSFAALRPAAEEWTAKREDEEPPAARGPEPLASIASAAIEVLAARGGDPESFHDLALLDAALEAGELGAPEAAVRRAVATAAARVRLRERSEQRILLEERKARGIPVYPLARDWGALLKAHAIARRMGRRFGTAGPERIVAAAEYNLRVSSFDEWSFA